MSAAEKRWSHLRAVPFGEVAEILDEGQRTLDKRNRQRVGLIAECERLISCMTDGRREADDATLEEWSRDLRAAVARARR